MTTGESTERSLLLMEGRFPGERSTTVGRFTGGDDRLVHVSPDGILRDFGYPLSGLDGIEHASFGLSDGERVEWFDGTAGRQGYLDGTDVVETRHETSLGSLTRYDLAVGAAHVTHVTIDRRADRDGFSARIDVQEEVDRSSTGVDSLLVDVSIRPEGREGLVGQLRFSDAVEVYHATEHDFVASATGIDAIEAPGTSDALTSPWRRRHGRTDGQTDSSRLSGDLCLTVPIENGCATVATLLTDVDETGRERALDRLRKLCSRYHSSAAFQELGDERRRSLPPSVPERSVVEDDLRVLELLSAPGGLRIAGPEFDPTYRHSGGYGYTWFRDDAEIAGFLLEADERLGLDLDAWHRKSVSRYVETQHEDGSWPHRVWPSDGTLAPGWANSRIESTSDIAYQADQTASVVSFLARASEAGYVGETGDVDEAIESGVADLVGMLETDGRPAACQNAWEDMVGRFTHTAATFLRAFSDVASYRSGEWESVDPAERATELYRSIDALWVEDRGCYALREEVQGEIDPRYDSATLLLAAAHRRYDAIDSVDQARLDRLVSHVETVCDELYRETDAIAGLVRYEDDTWRQDEQTAPKVWTVATAMGVDACCELAMLLDSRDDDRADRLADRANDLLALLVPEGPLTQSTTYLPEQLFDDGTPDSATPLGWSHALRLSAIATVNTEAPFVSEPRAADRPTNPGS